MSFRRLVADGSLEPSPAPAYELDPPGAWGWFVVESLPSRIGSHTSTLGAPRISVERATGDAMAESRTSSPDEAAAEEREELLATKLNLMSLHRSMVVGVELANVTREIAADHPGLAAPARVIAMRAQGEALRDTAVCGREIPDPGPEPHPEGVADAARP